jgi:phosphoribosylglycinamide formyltransferase 1
MKARLVVLASGSGTNLQAILDATASGRLRAEVVAVLSDNPAAKALERARFARVPSVVAVPRPERNHDRREWDSQLATQVELAEPDLIILAGFMRLLSPVFVDRFPGRVINLHPARPGELPGTHAIERAYSEFVAGTRESTGVMVHLVPDEGIDNGPVLAVADVPILPGDTVASLAERMHQVERELLVDTISELLASTQTGGLRRG